MLKKIGLIGIGLLLLASCKDLNKGENEDLARAEQPLQWLTLKGKKDLEKKLNIVLVSGDEEYRSEEALPQMAKILSKRHGFNCSVLFSQDSKNLGIINPNYRFNIPGLELLKKADLVIWFTRFRELPVDQMQFLEAYLTAGKPLIGIRTSTHAFNFEDKNHPYAHYGWDYQGENEEWHLGFGKKILGETWYTHHGSHKHQSTRGIISDSEDHPILNGIENGAIWGATDVYGVRTPLSEDSQILILGQTIDRSAEFDEDDLLYGLRETDTIVAKTTGIGDKLYNPNEQMPPIVWLNSYQLKNGKKGNSVTSTIGASTDLIDEEVRRLYINSVYYLLNLEVPKQANVDLIGDYRPNQFSFQSDDYWNSRELKVEDFKIE